MSKPIPKAMKAGMRKHIALVQVMAEEVARFYTYEEGLTNTEEAQLRGLLTRLGAATKNTLDAAVVIMDVTRGGPK